MIRLKARSITGASLAALILAACAVDHPVKTNENNNPTGDGDGGDGGDGDGDGDEPCAMGEEACECYGNSTCNDGLTCLSGLCVNESGGTGGDGTGGSGGTGGGGTGGDGAGGSDGTGGDGTGGDGTGGDGTGGDGTGGDGTGGETSTDCDLSGAGLDEEAIPASPGTMTLTNDKVWILDEIVLVDDGDVLTIEPCTRIEGEGSEGILVIGRGGQIMAEGTADEPILFTSQEAPGARQAGDWGGVVILGRAVNNQGPNVAIEGLPNDTDYQYGGDDDADNSGVVTYVRIEYAGVEIATGNEINGLTMGSVGSGTELHHIMVSNTLDDCFEWFGGAADASYLVGLNCGDDIFDYDQGYTGALKTAFGRQGEIDSSDPHGYEYDGNFAAEPFTDITSTNVTLCGLGEDNAPAETTYGAVLREGSIGAFKSQVFVGFHEGISYRDVESNDPGITFSDSMLFGNFVEDIGSAHEDSPGFDVVAWFEGGDGNDVPNSAPFTVEDCQASGGPNAAVTGSGIGAFAQESDWLQGAWISWDNE